jgi:hypothetical protein
VIAQRILAVLSAVLLVGSVALATVSPQMLTLGGALYQIDGSLPGGLHDWLWQHLGAWSWADVVLPLLLRPAWLMPASIGLICAGLALSLSNRKSARRSHRRS